VRSEFSDGTVSIRPYREDDVQPLFDAVRESVDEAYPWLPWCRPEYTLEDSRTWVSTRAEAWEKGEEYAFVIADGQDHFLGGPGLNHIRQQDGFGNLGYWVRTSCTGQGIATRAVRLLARFGFEELGLGRIELVAAVGNTASQRVAEKAGAHREGVLRRRLCLHDEYHDAVMYSLIPKDLALSDAEIS